MSTEQKYVGRGNLATSPGQTANSKATTSPASDERRNNSRVYQAQTDLLSLVDSFLELDSPIIAITDFMEEWLTAPPSQLADGSYFNNTLKSALRLISFLSELRDLSQKLERAERITQQEKEVSRG